MGNDLYLWAEGPVTPEQTANANRIFDKLLPGFAGDTHHDEPPVTISRSGHAAMYSRERWFGPRYTRGRWPLIAAAIHIMQASFPDATIRIGRHCPAGEPITEELMYRNWGLWLKSVDNSAMDWVPVIECDDRPPMKGRVR